jgi:hypothetical protein
MLDDAASFAVRDLNRPLPWFRFDADFATDPRIGMLSEFAQLVLIRAMCATARRVTPCADEHFAWWIRSDPKRLAKAKRELIEAELISEEWVPTDWDQRQPPTDRTAADRKRRQRERDRVAKGSPTVIANDDLLSESSKSQRDGTVTVTGVTPVQDRTGEERTGPDITDRTEQIRAHPAMTDAEATEPALYPTRDRNAIPSDPIPRRSIGAGRRSSQDFEEVNRKVGRLIECGDVPPNDLDGLAKASGYTPNQIAVSLRQLRDRGRL